MCCATSQRDVLGSCNLKCPSCPVGNFSEVKNPTGFMYPELLNKILHKATQECYVTGVGLYNWTEPLLNPQLPDLIKIVNSYGIFCGLSSNLNILKNPEDVLSANPHNFRISTSGFNQSIYGVTHRGGNIERVKENMIKLAKAKEKTGSRTQLNVLYHRYLGNLDDEILMKNFAENLGFTFQAVWAFMMPLEKVYSYFTGDESLAVLSLEDKELIDRLALPLKKALQVSQKYKYNPCPLRDNQMTLDFQGNVMLCCAVYDSSKHTLKSFLDTSIEDLQKLKYEHDTCTKCMDIGGHVYSNYGATEFDSIAADNLSIYYSNHVLG